MIIHTSSIVNLYIIYRPLSLSLKLIRIATVLKKTYSPAKAFHGDNDLIIGADLAYSGVRVTLTENAYLSLALLDPLLLQGEGHTAIQITTTHEEQQVRFPLCLSCKLILAIATAVPSVVCLRDILIMTSAVNVIL